MHKTAYDGTLEALEEVEKLKPTPDEILKYARANSGYSDFGPSIHDTWRQKFRGSVHIDIGFKVHLVLSRYEVLNFIEFVENLRKRREDDQESDETDQSPNRPNGVQDLWAKAPSQR